MPNPAFSISCHRSRPMQTERSEALTIRCIGFANALEVPSKGALIYRLVDRANLPS